MSLSLSCLGLCPSTSLSFLSLSSLSLSSSERSIFATGTTGGTPFLLALGGLAFLATPLSVFGYYLLLLLLELMVCKARLGTLGGAPGGRVPLCCSLAVLPLFDYVCAPPDAPDAPDAPEPILCLLALLA